MTANDLKLSINKLLEQVNDATVLEAYHEILLKLVKVQQAQIVGYTIDGQSLTRGALEKEIDEATARMDKGQGIDHAELRRNSDDW